MLKAAAGVAVPEAVEQVLVALAAVVLEPAAALELAVVLEVPAVEAEQALVGDPALEQVLAVQPASDRVLAPP
jgi:hypothetical protein